MSSTEQTSKTGCEGPASHDHHLCRLMERGKTAEIDRLTNAPNYSCRSCGAYANEAVTLCNPEAL